MAEAGNEPHTGTPEEGLGEDATSDDKPGKGSYVDVTHDDEGQPSGNEPAGDDEGHYVEVDPDDEPRQDTHPDAGDYTDADEGDDVSSPDAGEHTDSDEGDDVSSH